MSEDIAFFRTLDDQSAVRFTGRVNILDRLTRQLLGEVVLRDGEIWRCSFKGTIGLKAFFNIVISDYSGELQDFIVEPEIIREEDRHIHYPYPVLKKRALEVSVRYAAAARMRPPGHLKLIVRPEFLEEVEDVSEAEFRLLCSLTSWNSVDEVYQNCQLLDYEITESLVSLRKKKALQVVEVRHPTA